MAQFSIRYGLIRSSPAANPTSASPPWRDVSPAEGSRCMEMVPPVKRRWIIGSNNVNGER